MFKQTWLEVISRTRPEDVLSDTALLDTLHSKIKDSPMLKMELLLHYDMLPYDLLGMTDRYMMKQRESQPQTHIGLRQWIKTANKDNEKEGPTPAPKKGAKNKQRSKKLHLFCLEAKQKHMLEQSTTIRSRKTDHSQKATREVTRT